jgi:predicted ester cyclase
VRIPSKEDAVSAEDKKAVVRAFLEALDRHDFAALSEHPGLYHTVQRQPMIRTAFPDLRHTIEQQIAEGDTVATRATLRGTHLGPLMGVPPSNKVLTWSLLLMDRIVDGKIVLHFANADWARVFVELGVIAPPPDRSRQ